MKGFSLVVKWPGWSGVLRETLRLGLHALIGISGVIVSFLWILTISPFYDPYLSQTDYQRLGEQEDLMLALLGWAAGIYFLSVVLLYLARLFVRKSKS
ncbi:hypothetical protein [Vibrio echinoideorum]|uniref:hypothetical protein n=1 Tax=Vibrio echinoideorum TaxID=2100116 RepID=UPI003551F9E0